MSPENSQQHTTAFDEAASAADGLQAARKERRSGSNWSIQPKNSIRSPIGHPIDLSPDLYSPQTFGLERQPGMFSSSSSPSAATQGSRDRQAGEPVAEISRRQYEHKNLRECEGQSAVASKSEEPLITQISTSAPEVIVLSPMCLSAFWNSKFLVSLELFKFQRMKSPLLPYTCIR